MQALEGRPITLFGDGQQTRSFCYVSDLVEGLLAAARVADLDAPVNLGNPRESTMIELATLVRRLVSRPVEFIYKPLPSDDPKRRCPDIARASALLRFEPKVRLEDGLLATIENFRARLDARPKQVSEPASPS
jgi:UDP-glucuronate decarboxylase